jgi:hypothetical protein
MARIGEGKVHIVTRIVGIVMTALAVQFILNGITAYHDSLVSRWERLLPAFTPDQIFDGAYQRSNVRLVDAGRRPRFGRLTAVPLGHVGRVDDDRRVRVPPPQLPAQLQAGVDPRHLVEDEEVEAFTGGELLGVLRGGDDGRVVAGRAEQRGEHLADVRVVVHTEYALPLPRHRGTPPIA